MLPSYDVDALANAKIHFKASAPSIPAVPTMVSIDEPSLPQAKYGEGYNIQFQMQDGSAPEKVEFTSITPAGLTVNEDGTVTGIPRVVGTYPALPIECTDSAGNTVLKEFDLKVMPQEVHVEVNDSAAAEYDGTAHALPLMCVEEPYVELSALYGVNKTTTPTDAGIYYAQVFSTNPAYRVLQDKAYYLTIEKSKVKITHSPQTYTYNGQSHAYEYTAEGNYEPVVKYKEYSDSDNLTSPSQDSGYTETPPTEKGKYRVWISASDKNHKIYDGSGKSPWYVFGVLEITD